MYREVVDGIILVVRAEVTPKRAVQQTIDMIGTEKVLGFVFNGVQQSFQPYYKYYGQFLLSNATRGAPERYAECVDDRRRGLLPGDRL